MNACPEISAEQHFLAEALEPIRAFLDDPAVVEISCQRSNELWLEKIGQLSMVRQRVDGLEAPLAGRDRELRLVKELFHATEESGRPRLVVVDGEPGVGKSRLAWEFSKYVDGLSSDVVWHQGRCLSYGDGAAYWALAEAVRARLGLVEESTSDESSDARPASRCIPGTGGRGVSEAESSLVSSVAGAVELGSLVAVCSAWVVDG